MVGIILLSELIYHYMPLFILKWIPVEQINSTQSTSVLSDEELKHKAHEANRMAEGRTPDIVGTSTDIGSGWAMYTNKKFAISFEYPKKDMKPFEFHYPYRKENGARENYGAYFADAEGDMGIMSITITPNTYLSAENWVSGMQDSAGSSSNAAWKIEQHVTTHGIKGLLVSEISVEDIGATPKPHGPWIVYYKSGSTYVFTFRWMKNVDIERVWKSFQTR